MHFPANIRSTLLRCLIAGLSVSVSLHSLARDAVSSGFSVEKTERGATVKADGALVAEYVTDQANKPYLWPVIGPTGKPVTRAFPMEDVAGDVKDHPHHRSIWFGHEDINGVDTWTENATWKGGKPQQKDSRLSKLGAIKHREFRELKGDAEKAVIASVSDFVGPQGEKTLEQEQRITFRKSGDARLIDYDMVFTASEGPVRFGDMKDAGFNIRVATSMAVDSKQGGKIINSEGVTDAAAWAKRAKWVDYHGPVDGETVGIAILDHPSNLRHPTPWHVRTYGLFTANPFGTRSLDPKSPDGAFTVQKGERLKLRYRVILHKGDEKAGRIAEAFETYAGEKE